MSRHLLLYYKGDISALTLFCQQADGHLCFPPLPKLSLPVDSENPPEETVELYPRELIDGVNRLLRLDDDILQAEPGFYCQIETPDGMTMVYLARFRLLDPPHRMMAERHCKLQTLTALMGRPPAEMELLRQAYLHLMET